jgi:glutathione S-transferase
VLEGHLQAQSGRGEAFLAANRFTVADLCVASVANWIRPAAGLLAQYPVAGAWLHACLARDAHQQALVFE